MDTQFDETIKFFSVMHNLDPRLVKAFCFVESSFKPFASRYEPNWRYLTQVDTYAILVGSSSATERVHQSTSWGLMQVMGSVARELGFLEKLPMLCLPEHGIEMGCKKLEKLSKFYHTPEELAAAYNAGTAKLLESGFFGNQDYVDKIMRAYNDLG